MPYYGCSNCHHEFELGRSPDKSIPIVCDWCEAGNPIVLEEKTPLERMCQNPETVKQLLENLKP